MQVSKTDHILDEVRVSLENRLLFFIAVRFFKRVLSIDRFLKHALP